MPAKGGGKAVNRGPNFYAGYCYKCGKYGHRSTTCRVVMGIFDEVMGDAAPLASVVDGELKVPRLLLIDSGAFIHTCPRGEYPGSPMEPIIDKPGAIVADGRALKLYGSKKVHFETANGTNLIVNFYVSEVSRSILSVGQLKRDGCDVDFVGCPSMRISDTVVPLYERSNLFYLPMRLRGERWSLECQRQLRSTCCCRCRALQLRHHSEG
eukprot:12771465-Heterocapsa_arctica.AAC.1